MSIAPFRYRAMSLVNTCLSKSFFRMLPWVQNFLLVNPGWRQWTEQDTVYLVSRVYVLESQTLPVGSMLDNSILFKESIYDTASKSSD